MGKKSGAGHSACSGQRGAALNTKDEDGRSPLDCAVLGEHAGAASALKERGASSSFVQNGNTLMHQLATEGSAVPLSILLGNSDEADLPNAHGYTALHLATLHGKLAAAELLYETKLKGHSKKVFSVLWSQSRVLVSQKTQPRHPSMAPSWTRGERRSGGCSRCLTSRRVDGNGATACELQSAELTH